MSVISIDTAEGLFLYQRVNNAENKIIAISTKVIERLSLGVGLKGYFITEWKKGR